MFEYKFFILDIIQKCRQNNKVDILTLNVHFFKTIIYVPVAKLSVRRRISTTVTNKNGILYMKIQKKWHVFSWIISLLLIKLTVFSCT